VGGVRFCCCVSAAAAAIEDVVDALKSQNNVCLILTQYHIHIDILAHMGLVL
jgi:hypothetical protein